MPNRHGREIMTWLAFVGLTAVLMLRADTALGQQLEPIPVFVTSIGAVNGMTDPSKDNLDTVRDLKGDLKDYKKEVRLVESAEDAVIVLTVIGRETAQVTAGFLGDPARDRIIRVKFEVGDMQTEMTASAQGGTLGSGGAWGKAAGKIAKQVREWITANRGKLVQDEG
jgi:hypothetical protein